MSIVKWAAALVTGLMGLMNAGQVLDSSSGAVARLVSATLAVLAGVAIIGLVSRRTWGRSAVIGVGLLNATFAVAAAFTGVQGWPVALIVGGLGALLAGMTRTDLRADGEPA